jgi:hypothetical protein
MPRMLSAKIIADDIGVLEVKNVILDDIRSPSLYPKD